MTDSKNEFDVSQIKEKYEFGDIIINPITNEKDAVFLYYDEDGNEFWYCRHDGPGAKTLAGYPVPAMAGWGPCWSVPIDKFASEVDEKLICH